MEKLENNTGLYNFTGHWCYRTCPYSGIILKFPETVPGIYKIFFLCACDDWRRYDSTYMGPDVLKSSPLHRRALKNTMVVRKFSGKCKDCTARSCIREFLSGLQVTPDEQYESAMLDGATTFQKFRYLTFPYILPTVTVNLVLIIKAGFTTFDYSYALTGGGPVRATEVIGIMIYNDAFQNMKFSMANAEACVLFIIIAVFSVIQIKLTSRGGVNT